ncbi:hypothetical protein D3C73_940990 [compost metagenome]
MAEHAAQPIGNRQAQPQAFFGAGLMAVEALEFFEDHFQFVFGNPRAAIPDFQAQLAPAPTYSQQHRATGIAESIGEEVLQDPAQQLDVAVDPQVAAAHPELEPLLACQRLELRAENVKQLVEHERLGIRVDLAVFQARNIQQVADQVFGRAQ